jgi:hypothetical protein
MNKINENQPIEEYLKGRYRDQINWYDKKSIRNKNLYYFFQWEVIILSTVTPVLVAYLPDLKLVTVLVSIALAIGTSALKTFKFQENWINYRRIGESLKIEQYYMQAGVGAYKNANDKYQLFVERVESLLSRERSLWITTHHQERNEPDKKDEKDEKK